jgi:hypothetical protein
MGSLNLEKLDWSEWILCSPVEKENGIEVVVIVCAWQKRESGRKREAFITSRPVRATVSHGKD